MIQMAWPHPDHPLAEAANALGRELRDDFAASSRYPYLAVYVNYAHGDETSEQMYGKEKFLHPAALKKRWDSDNVFAYDSSSLTDYPLAELGCLESNVRYIESHTL
jgi:hypothetical protein